MKSSSLRALTKVPGIPNIKEYRDELTYEWYVNPLFQEKLAIFILRETTPQQLFFNLKDGELTVNGKQYSVTWLHKPVECRKAQALLVSLRYCKYLERGYALVKILLGNGEYEILTY